MKRGILRHKSALWLITALALASCSQDELAEQGTALPEGVYPLEIASVTLDVEGSAQPWGVDAPQTRVSETDDRNGSTWDWDGTEQIGVQLYDGGDEAIYTLTEDHTLSADRPLYWKDTQQATVKAWYPATGGEIDLTRQKENNCLAYVLTGTGKGDYQTPVSLSFTHALAKIRVLLTGEQAEQVTSVQVKSYTKCTHDKGTVSGSSEGWIEMLPATYNNETYWEANVVPDHEIKEIQLNSDTPCTLEGIVNPVGGSYHEITITVNKKIPDVITEPGDYVIKGTIDKSITLNASGINLTLDNVQATTSGAPIIIGKNAQVTLNISGTDNSLTSTDGNGIEIGDGASLTITGKGKDASKLVVKASEKQPDITALRAGIGPSTGNVSIKTITISNVHLVVSGGKAEWNGSGPAAIGLCSVNDGYQQSCEGISITDSKIEAASYGGACIGTGAVSNSKNYESGGYTLGSIIIKGSEIRATANENGYSGECGSCIGFGIIGTEANGVIKGITIDNSTLNLTVASNSAYKVGRGKVLSNANATYSITDGIVVNGEKKGNADGWNP